MCKEIYDRLVEIIPPHNLSELELEELQVYCKIAFNVIGYEPKNLENSFDKVFKSSSDFHELSDFIYSVYKEDSQ